MDEVLALDGKKALARPPADHRSETWGPNDQYERLHGRCQGKSDGRQPLTIRRGHASKRLGIGADVVVMRRRPKESGRPPVPWSDRHSSMVTTVFRRCSRCGRCTQCVQCVQCTHCTQCTQCRPVGVSATTQRRQHLTRSFLIGQWSLVRRCKGGCECRRNPLTEQSPGRNNLG